MSDQLTYDNWDKDKVIEISQHFKDYFDVLKWSFQYYQKEIVYSCSFGAEGIVLIDLISKVNNQAKIIFLDTGLHFPETYELIENVKKRYPTMHINKIRPKTSLEEQAKWYGEDLWKDNPNLCCYMRKIAPLQDALKDVKAWISGLRRDQSPSRSLTEFINRDNKFQKIKICPLIHWTWDDIMSYIKINKLPYNPLHDNGYPSIGCAPCTSPVLKTEDPRSGRWSGISKIECGLHQT